MSATWSGLEFTACNFLPMVVLDVEDMHIVHPVYSIVTTKIDYFRIDQASGG